MFDHTRAEEDTAAFLAAIPLLQGVPEKELAELARIVRRRALPAGEVLWREGDDFSSMLLVVDGRVSVTLHLPGDREVEVSNVGRGEVLGEVPLIGGGAHSGTAIVTEDATL